MDRESLKLLGISEQATVEEIRAAYLKKTSHGKFRAILLTNESLKREFSKYFEAYVNIMKDSIQEKEASSKSYYPPEQVFSFLFNQGVYYLIQQNYLKAGEKLQSAYEINKRDVRVLIYLGVLLIKRKNFYAAEKYLNEALKLESENEDVYYYLGENYLKAGNLEKAHLMFRKSQSLNPSRQEIAFKLKEIQDLKDNKATDNTQKGFFSIFKKPKK